MDPLSYIVVEKYEWKKDRRFIKKKSKIQYGETIREDDKGTRS